MRDFDGQGKSHLCERLKKDFSAALTHVSAPKTKNAFKEYVDLLKDLNPSKNYVFDRCFHGERVYGPVYRGKSMVNDEQQLFLELLVQRHNVKCVYCWTDLQNTREVFKTRGEQFTKLEDVAKLHQDFSRVIKNSRLEWFWYDWRFDSYATMVERFWLTRGHPGSNGDNLDMLGLTTPDVLLVGDKKNEKLKGVPIFCSTSGMFLMRGLPPVKLAIVNSDSCLNEKLSWLKPKVIVALGKNASKRLAMLNVEFNKIVHPQYAKRFYGKNAVQRYSTEIMEAINR